MSAGAATLVRAARARVRARVRVCGTVQGVGFRPYVYRLARELGLAGWVLNDAHGVLLEVEGAAGAVDAFLSRLRSEAPPLAVIDGLSHDVCPPTGERAFEIRPSPIAAGEQDAPVAPDTATCADCLRELLDPADRRYRYPFINCTNCGPRFTIVRGVPYDRPLTTMASFHMCEACRAEYEDPADRRFHAQPNACPACGPSVVLLGRDGRRARGSSPGDDPIRTAAAALRDGAIVAIKGLGGYHLACRADDERTVATLRARKHREDRPFALMVASPRVAERLVSLGDGERELLCAPGRPIVLALRRVDAPVAVAVAPSAAELGLMLPYTPLHHLLLAQLGDDVPALVMTSGNVSDEPIAFEDADAFARLVSIADLFLTHDRPIETRTDDSVVRVVDVGRPGARSAFVRRSRGWVPSAIALPDGAPAPLLACGAQLKSTFCVAKGSRAWVSHHIGDLANYETLASFTAGIEHFQRLFDVAPRVVAHDLHPEYLSTKYALERGDGVSLVGVQHHHAHLAACLAEHGIDRPAVGAIFDGSGYGTDGTIWGGEILYGDTATFERAGALLAVRLPGGERAIREPWRMACAWLAACG
ncbi:MAG: carbamoyltransferase HypF, partial [Solirubrobacteraceae bacterium]